MASGEYIFVDEFPQFVNMLSCESAIFVNLFPKSKLVNDVVS